MCDAALREPQIHAPSTTARGCALVRRIASNDQKLCSAARCVGAHQFRVDSVSVARGGTPRLNMRERSLSREKSRLLESRQRNSRRVFDTQPSVQLHQVPSATSSNADAHPRSGHQRIKIEESRGRPTHGHVRRTLRGRMMVLARFAKMKRTSDVSLVALSIDARIVPPHNVVHDQCDASASASDCWSLNGCCDWLGD